MSMSKKLREKAILNLVYADNDYAEVVDAEEPDFDIRHRHLADFFGVEVTEYFPSGSDARLKNIPDYASAILAGGKVRHKADKTILTPIDVTLYSPDGQNKGAAKAILQRPPEASVYLAGIASRILDKEARFPSYRSNLDHINLIVFDNTGMLLLDPLDFYRSFYTEAIRQILCGTKFREVFFVTRLKGDRQVFLPLKEILLVAEFHKFEFIMWEYFPDRVGDQLNDFMVLFAEYMSYRTGTACFRTEAGKVEVIFGNCGLMLEEERLTITPFFDHPLPTDLRIPNSPSSCVFFGSNEFKDTEEQVSKTRIFSTELAFDVKGQPVD